jgi:iron complex transport system ATP-binding protein
MIRLEGLSFGYKGGKRPVLTDLDLEIPGGAATAVLGPNGSGKTTLLRLLLGVLRPQAGRIHLDGRPQDEYTRRELSQLVGLVPQDEHIPFDFTILEYVLLGRSPYLGPLEMPKALDHEIAMQALESAGLGDMQHRHLPNLSGGERQLATVARALAQQPRVLLLDEPAAHLDLSNQGRLLAIMGQLVAGGVTLILTTHDPNLAARIASHTVLMNGGGVLAAGTSGEMLTAEWLSRTYGVPVEVIQSNGRRVIALGSENAP